jgi:hypothetical protein
MANKDGKTEQLDSATINLNTKWLGLFSIPMWGKIVLNILIPLIVGGLVLGIARVLVANPEQGAITLCLALLSALCSSIIMLLIKREFEAENMTSVCNYINSVGTNIDGMNNNISQFEFLKDRNHFIDKSIDSADKVISGLVSHLAKDCYLRCSKNSDKCMGCPRFSRGECNGLLRNYLYNTCETLENAIKDYRDGIFKLATNIRKFHTLAIDHLMGYSGQTYSVMHYIGNEKTHEETYDNLDSHFLHTLLHKITAKNNNISQTYYEKNNFKIKWLLIGDEKNIENNYDYIFYVAEKHLKIPDEIMDDLFEFYIISNDDYKNKTSSHLTLLGDFAKQQVQAQPSVGIFGDYFMFIDSTKPDEHGTIYTRMHDRKDNKNSVSEVFDFFNNTIQSASQKKFTELKQFYSNLPDNHKNNYLKERCKIDSYNNNSL